MTRRLRGHQTARQASWMFVLRVSCFVKFVFFVKNHKSHVFIFWNCYLIFCILKDTSSYLEGVGESALWSEQLHTASEQVYFVFATCFTSSKEVKEEPLPSPRRLRTCATRTDSLALDAHSDTTRATPPARPTAPPHSRHAAPRARQAAPHAPHPVPTVRRRPGAQSIGMCERTPAAIRPHFRK